MADYARNHHPQAIARKLASGHPFLNSFSASVWRKKLADIGIKIPAKATKGDLYCRWLEANGFPLKSRKSQETARHWREMGGS